MANDNILKMIKIHKSFGGLHDLEDVSLELRHSEILGLVGDKY